MQSRHTIYLHWWPVLSTLVQNDLDIPLRCCFALNILFLVMLFYQTNVGVNAKHITGNAFAILKSSHRESAMELNGKKFYKLFNKLFFVHIEEIVYGFYIGFRIIKKKQSS